MEFFFDGAFETPWLDAMRAALGQAMVEHGHQVTSRGESAGLVFHEVSTTRPRPFRRRSQATFVVGLASWENPPDHPLEANYPLLVRSLSNLLIAGGPAIENTLMLTPELGIYRVAPNGDPAAWRTELYSRVAPLATSHLIIDNVFDEDLPPELWGGTPVTDALRTASRRLAEWNLLPAPYPVSDLLPPEDYRHLQRVYGIGGLSYGNLSARHAGSTFWMSASGVDKGKIGTVSRDILLVKGYDPERRAMRLSVTPGASPLRVSVDAIEHWGIYRELPQIGAMVHVHAWVDGIPSTEVNYPCGTVEMGEAMAELLRRSPAPDRAIVGLKNHGFTATGPTFADIFERLEGHVVSQVPMT